MSSPIEQLPAEITAAFLKRKENKPAPEKAADHVPIPIEKPDVKIIVALHRNKRNMQSAVKGKTPIVYNDKFHVARANGENVRADIPIDDLLVRTKPDTYVMSKAMAVFENQTNILLNLGYLASLENPTMDQAKLFFRLTYELHAFFEYRIIEATHVADLWLKAATDASPEMLDVYHALKAMQEDPAEPSTPRTGRAFVTMGSSTALFSVDLATAGQPLETISPAAYLYQVHAKLFHFLRNVSEKIGYRSRPFVLHDTSIASCNRVLETFASAGGVPAVMAAANNRFVCYADDAKKVNMLAKLVEAFPQYRK